MTILKTSLLAICLLYCLNLSAKNPAQDTLHVVREDQFLHYPFGTFKSLKSFENAYKKTFLAKLSKRIKPYKNGEKVQTRMFIADNSYTNFYLDKNTKNLETVNAIIFNDQIPLKNGITTGMNKADFLKILNIPADNAAKINIVQLASKANDIHHYYQFKDDKLTVIKIFSKIFYSIK